MSIAKIMRAMVLHSMIAEAKQEPTDRDSDRSGEAGETGTGSTEGESAGRRHRPNIIAHPHSKEQAE